MGIFDSIKNALSGAKSKLPENLNSPEELKAKAQDLSAQHGDKVNQAIDTIQDKLPGQTGDKVIDGVQQKFNDFSKKQ